MSDCIACAYLKGALEESEARNVPSLAPTMDALSATVDGIAYGIGIGLFLASLASEARQRVLDGFCEEHRQCLDEVQRDFNEEGFT